MKEKQYIQYIQKKYPKVLDIDLHLRNAISFFNYKILRASVQYKGQQIPLNVIADIHRIGKYFNIVPEEYVVNDDTKFTKKYVDSIINNETGWIRLITPL